MLMGRKSAMAEFVVPKSSTTSFWLVLVLEDELLDVLVLSTTPLARLELW